MSKNKLSSACPIFWVCGNYYDARKQWLKICADIKEKFQEEINFQDIECGHLSDSIPESLKPSLMTDVVMLLKSDDIFDRRPRVVRLFGCPPDYDILYDYLHFIDERNQVVIYGPIGYNIPAGSSTRFITAKTSNLYKSIKGWNQVFDFPIEVDQDELAVNWVKRVSSELGKPISPDAAMLLVEYKGRNLDTLFGELTKLCDYCDTKTISLPDIESVCIPEFTKTVWDFIDCLDLRQYDQACVLLQQFYMYIDDLTDAEFNAKIEQLLGALEHHFTFLMFATVASARQGFSFNSVKEQVEGLKKREKKGKEWKWSKEAYDYGFLKRAFTKKTVITACKWSTKESHEVLLSIYETSKICRILGTRDACKESINLLVMHICGKITYRVAKKVRRKTMPIMV